MSFRPLTCKEALLPGWPASANKLFSRWAIQQDMNCDGVFTISDVWLWVKYFFFAPGDGLLEALAPTAIGTFFELAPVAYGGWFSGLVSAVIWFVALYYMLFAVVLFYARLDRLDARDEQARRREHKRAED